MSNDMWKSLKYKNVAVFLGIILLIILIIFASCSDTTPSVDPNAQKAQTISKNESPTEAKQSTLFASSKKMELNNNESLGKGNLILVNNDNAYAADLTDSVVSLIQYNTNSDGDQLFSLTDSSVCSLEPAALQMQSMMTAFYAKNSDSSLFISTGYVAPDDQESLAFDSGKNDAGTGLSFNLGLWSDDSGMSAYDGSGDYSWITDNMAKYGFVTRYPSDKSDITGTAGDPAIIRYVGLPHAEIMSANGFCLEEYINYIKTYTFENPLQQTGSNGVVYAVYYTEMKKGNTTEIKIPTKADGTEYTYSISGNNVDGYIVTVAMEKSDGSASSGDAKTASSNSEAVTQAASVFNADSTEAAQGTTKTTTTTVTPFIPES